MNSLLLFHTLKKRINQAVICNGNLYRSQWNSQTFEYVPLMHNHLILFVWSLCWCLSPDWGCKHGNQLFCIKGHCEWVVLSLSPISFLSKLVICRGAYSSDQFCSLILHEIMGFSFLLQSQLFENTELVVVLTILLYLSNYFPTGSFNLFHCSLVSYELEISLKVSLNSTCVSVTRTLHG